TGGADRAQAQGMVWVLEAGSALGWVSWALGGAALLVWVRQRGLLPKVHGTAVVGLGLLGEAACPGEALVPGWGCRALMLGWAGFAFGFAAVTWSLAAARTVTDKARAFDRAAPAGVWVGVMALAVVLLALKAALGEQDYVWAALAVAGASLALALTALRQQCESWALAAGLAANLAVSLLFWSYHLTHGIDAWQVRLLQVNLITCAATILMWLGTHRLGRANVEPIPPGVLLTAQLGVAAVGN